MDIYPLTKITSYNPLWKVQAWCRRNNGRFYLYEQDNGNVEISSFERQGEDVLELWVDGTRRFRDPRRPDKVERLVG